ncbi:MAG: DUF5671 domain-containing protein [bacterium]|nr:DUF5671 domain-containing protein [bacterium]
MTNETKSHSPREVFLHLLAIVTLYMSAFNFGRLIFGYINRSFPDLLEGRYYSNVMSNESMRWSIAMLIIGFPIYFFTTRFLQRLYARNPWEQTRRIRKWLVYLTLFLAAVVVIGDLVTLIYTFLGGELTVRFALKVFTVFGVAAAIFGYYFWELKHFRESGDEDENTSKWNSRIRYFVGAIILMVVANVVVGFFMVGSPKKERLARFDGQRINDLQMLQNEIINFWQMKSRLPLTLDELKNDITGFIPPYDPETKIPYQYASASPLEFELCGNFSSSTQSDSMEKSRLAVPYPISAYDGFGNWNHEAGRVCFSRTIDPERFRPEMPGKM